MCIWLLIAGSDGDIVTNIPVPMNYTLMVEATSTNDSNQNATDTVGPISLSGGSATCMFCVSI